MTFTCVDLVSDVAVRAVLEASMNSVSDPPSSATFYVSLALTLSGAYSLSINESYEPISTGVRGGAQGWEFGLFFIFLPNNFF